MSELIVEVCKIQNIFPHTNADKLELAVIKGWQCVVQKGKYKKGDLIVYIPPDCILPESLINQFDLSYLRGGGRTGTVKLRGEISYGLVLPLPDGNWKEGDSVAEFWGIIKWMPPENPQIQGQPKNRVKNENLHKYYDIQNIKNFPDLFTEDDEVVVTEKIHGMSAKFGNLERKPKNIFEKFLALFGKKFFEFVYASNNVQLGVDEYGSDVWGQIAKKYDLMNLLPQGITVYAEVYGRGIQDLTYGLEGIDFAVFDITAGNGIYVDWEDVEWFCSEDKWNLPIVPVLYKGKYYNGLLEQFTSGKSLICKNQIREGIVIKTAIEQSTRRHGRKILKSISPEYLTRKNGTEFN